MFCYQIMWPSVLWLLLFMWLGCTFWTIVEDIKEAPLVLGF